MSEIFPIETIAWILRNFDGYLSQIYCKKRSPSIWMYGNMIDV